MIPKINNKYLFKVKIWNTVYPAFDIRTFYIWGKSSKSVLKFLVDAEIVQKVHNCKIERQIEKLKYDNPSHRIAIL